MCICVDGAPGDREAEQAARSVCVSFGVPGAGRVSAGTCAHTQGAVVKPGGQNQTPELQQALSTPG